MLYLLFYSGFFMDFYFILDCLLTKNRILSRSSNGDATNCSWVSAPRFVERLGNINKNEFFKNVRRDSRTFCESFWKR